MLVVVGLLVAGCSSDGGPWATSTTTQEVTVTASTTTLEVTTTVPLNVRVAPDGSGDAPDLAAAVRLVASGGTITLDPGEYLLAAPLEIDKPLTIRTESGPVDVIGDQPPYLLHFAGPGNLAVERVDFRYEGLEAADGLVVEGGTFAFDNVEVKGAVRAPADEADPAAEPRGGTGFLVGGDATGTMDRCRAADNQLHGFSFEGTSRVTINGLAENNAEAGFRWADESVGQAEGSTARGNGLHGFDVEDHAVVTLLDNTAVGNAQGGFAWQGSSSGSGEGNTARENGLHGFGVEEEAEAVLADNTASANGQCGFKWDDSAAGEGRRNTAEANGLCGFWIGGAAAPTLVNNIARSNRHREGYGSGFAYAGTAGGIGRRNQVYDNDWGIALGPDARPRLADNDVHDNSRDLYEDAPIY